MTIRTASIRDIDNILPLQLETHQYHFELDKIYTPRVDLKKSFKTHLESLLQEKNSIVLIAEENDELVGYVIGKLKEPHSLFNIPLSGLIDDIGVTDKQRNKGTGEKLVNELILRFKTKGAERIELKVHAQNQSGYAFWIKMGFSCFLQEMHKPL